MKGDIPLFYPDFKNSFFYQRTNKEPLEFFVKVIPSPWAVMSGCFFTPIPLLILLFLLLNTSLHPISQLDFLQLFTYDSCTLLPCSKKAFKFLATLPSSASFPILP
jgi:hypothetical protein